MLTNLHLLDDWTFVIGEGDPTAKTACAMSAFSVLNGEKNFTDESPCVSRILRMFIIAMNDSIPYDDLRQRFAINIIAHIGGTAGGSIEDEQQKRFALWSVCQRVVERSGFASTVGVAHDPYLYVSTIKCAIGQMCGKENMTYDDAETLHREQWELVVTDAIDTIRSLCNASKKEPKCCSV